MAESGLHVVFGTGPVGRAVMDDLLACGFLVRMVNRSGGADLPDDVESMVGDAADVEFARAAATGADAVYLCLAPPLHRWYDLFPPLQDAVLAAAMHAGAKLVAIDPMHAYGPPHAKHLTESDPISPNSLKGALRADMVAALLAAHDRGDVRVAVGRAPDYFGPNAGRAMLGDDAIARLLAGRPVRVLGDPDLPHTYSFVPDIGMGLVVLALHDRADGEVWHLPNPETRSTTALIGMLAEEAGVPAYIHPVSRSALRWTGFFDLDVRESIELLYQFEEPLIVSSDHFEATFDIGGTKLREAARRTISWYHDRMAG